MYFALGGVAVFVFVAVLLGLIVMCYRSHPGASPKQRHSSESNLHETDGQTRNGHQSEVNHFLLTESTPNQSRRLNDHRTTPVSHQRTRPTDLPTQSSESSEHWDEQQGTSRDVSQTGRQPIGSNQQRELMRVGRIQPPHHLQRAFPTFSDAPPMQHHGMAFPTTSNSPNRISIDFPTYLNWSACASSLCQVFANEDSGCPSLHSYELAVH